MSFKLFCVATLVAALALMAVGCGNPSDEEIEQQLEAIFNEATSEALNMGGTLAENANLSMDLKATMEAEGFTATVNGYLDNWANPEDKYGFETPEEGNKFIALNVTVTNNGTEEAEASSLYYTVDFGGEEKAEHSYYGTTAPNIVHFDSTKLAPGASYTGDFLFEVPATSGPADWTLVYNSDPFNFKEGYEPVRVSLQ